MLVFDHRTCQNLDEATRREWVVANGIGGYASSTISGIATRRYHGLLVAAMSPPVGRTVLVARLEDTVCTAQGHAELSSCRYPGVVHPDGFARLAEARFELGLPVLLFDCPGGQIEKSILMPQGENTTIVSYRWLGSEPARLVFRPMLTCRDYHHLMRANAGLDEGHQGHAGGASFHLFPGAPAVRITAAGGDGSAAAYSHVPAWYYNIQYDREAERGLDSEEDQFSPGILRLDLLPEKTAHVVLSTDRCEAASAERLCSEERMRREGLLALSPLAGEDRRVAALVLAADSFLVRRGDGFGSVLAGYHWFCDWGRDTMVALPGLTLPTGRPEVARQILRSYAQFVDEGMLPNRFPDSGAEPDYNTVDATLWYLVALRRYLGAQADDELAAELMPKLTEIVECHVGGTRYGIRMDDDGLLLAGDHTTQLTWMDAKVGDWVVTPRHGKPVEVSALWYNALKTWGYVAERLGQRDCAKRAERLADRTKRSFIPTFYDKDAGYLADCVVDGCRDMSLRPNQLLAMSLPYRLVDRLLARLILPRLQAELLTPFGLRSLSASDTAYRGSYAGDQWSRDGAYHQGTVWAWLIGPFVDAWLHAHGKSARTTAEVFAMISPLLKHVQDAGVGTVSEIFDGNASHEPRGCVSQAWSVAEVLRVLAMVQ